MSFHFPYGGWYVPGKKPRFETVGIYGHFGWAIESIPEMEQLDRHQNINGVYYKDWMLRRGYGFVRFGSTAADDFHGLQVKKALVVPVLIKVVEIVPESEFSDWMIDLIDYRKKYPESVKVSQRQVRNLLRTGQIPKA